MTRNEQFAFIEAAGASLLRWAKDRGIPLHRIEHVVPFVDADFSLSAWFFYETDEQLVLAEDESWRDRLATSYIGILRSLGYPSEWISRVTFFFDSHENVVRRFEGSYFYRLR